MFTHVQGVAYPRRGGGVNISFRGRNSHQASFFPCEDCLFERPPPLFQEFKGFGRDKKILFFFAWFSLPSSKRNKERKDRVEAYSQLSAPKKAALLKGGNAAIPILGGRFGYFLFFLLGRGKGEFEAPGGGGGGVRFLLKIPGGGGGGVQEGEGPGGCLRRIGDIFWGGGRGAKYFFVGPKCPPSIFCAPPKNRCDCWAVFPLTAVIALTFQSLLSSFPRFFRFTVVLAFLCVFVFLFQGFQGFRREENPCFFRGILAFFAQKARIGGSG